MNCHAGNDPIQAVIENASSRADKAAAAVDMKTNEVKSINLNDVYFPVFYKDFGSAEAASSTQILSGQQEISMTVQVTLLMS